MRIPRTSPTTHRTPSKSCTIRTTASLSLLHVAVYKCWFKQTKKSYITWWKSYAWQPGRVRSRECVLAKRKASDHVQPCSLPAIHRVSRFSTSGWHHNPLHSYLSNVLAHFPLSFPRLITHPILLTPSRSLHHFVYISQTMYFTHHMLSQQFN